MLARALTDGVIVTHHRWSQAGRPTPSTSSLCRSDSSQKRIFHTNATEWPSVEARRRRTHPIGIAIVVSPGVVRLVIGTLSKPTIEYLSLDKCQLGPARCRLSFDL